MITGNARVDELVDAMSTGVDLAYIEGAGVPTTAASPEDSRQGVALGATSPESCSEILRNVLVALNCAGEAVAYDGVQFHSSDITAMRRLLAEALTRLEEEQARIRKNVQLSTAALRRMVDAPRPKAIIYVPGRRVGDVEFVDFFLVALSNGSLKRYAPSMPLGRRWSDCEPVPDTPAGIVAELDLSEVRL